MSQKTILVAGATGVNGYAVAHHFSNHPEYNVLTLSTEALYYNLLGSSHLQVDLKDPEDANVNTEQLRSITHIFYAVLKPADDPKQEADENAVLFQNCIEWVRKHSDHLQHVTFLQGGKVYGAHLGIYPTPAFEGQTRHFPPNLYFRHEDYIANVCQDGQLTYTALRPDILMGYSLYSAMNMGNLIGVYASICKETGMDFMFPGTPKAFEVLVNVTDADIVAEAVEWSFQDTTPKNTAYNITNGDVFRWKQAWKSIAEFYQIPLGTAQPVSLQTYFDANEERWKEMVTKYSLKDLKISEITTGDFGDFIFAVEHDAIFDVNKARRNGFSPMTRKSTDGIVDHLKHLQAEKIIPTFT